MSGSDSAPHRPRWAVFLGPSLPRDQARGILDARYLPPARRGDIWDILSPDLPGIILLDGVFHGQPAIWPREILDALAGGIPVIGASSMGALRAAELAPFGMIGEGRVFRWYRDGVLDADDAVALLHGPEELGWAPVTLPLVNVKATLDAARSAGTLTPQECDEAESAARALPFQDRTAARLVEGRADAGWAGERLERLRRLLGPELKDVKAEDARTALERVARGDLVAPPADPDHWASLPPRWRQDRLLRGTFDGTSGAELAERLAGDAPFARRTALEALAEGGLPLTPPTSLDAIAAPQRVPGRDLGLLPAEAAVLTARRRRLESAVAREPGPPAEGLTRLAARWARSVGAQAAPPAALGPDRLGLPWEPRVALLESWLCDRMLGSPPWAG